MNSWVAADDECWMEDWGRVESTSLSLMIKRLWWFLVGVTFGGLIMVKALKRKPTLRALKNGAVSASADVLNVAARLLRPSSSRGESERMRIVG